MRLLRLLLLLVGAALLIPPVGCASVPKIEVPKEVLIEVPVSCVSEKPARPALRGATEIMAMGDYLRTLAAWAELRALSAYVAELEAAVDGCARLSPSR